MGWPESGTGCLEWLWHVEAAISSNLVAVWIKTVAQNKSALLNSLPVGCVNPSPGQPDCFPRHCFPWSISIRVIVVFVSLRLKIWVWDSSTVLPLLACLFCHSALIVAGTYHA